MILPVETTKFGYRFRDPTWYSDHHLGLDLVAPLGDPIKAPESGVVKWIGSGKQGGKTTHFIGDSGLIHRFLHQYAYFVKIGERVHAGAVIGAVGNTGMKQPNGKPMIPHLHWDISKNGKIDIYKIDNFIDPEVWVGGDPMFPKRQVIEQWGKLLELFGHPPFTELDFDIHMKAKTPKELASGFKDFLKQWLKTNGSISVKGKEKLIEFIKKL